MTREYKNGTEQSGAMQRSTYLSVIAWLFFFLLPLLQILSYIIEGSGKACYSRCRGPVHLEFCISTLPATTACGIGLDKSFSHVWGIRNTDWGGGDPPGIIQLLSSSLEKKISELKSILPTLPTLSLAVELERKTLHFPPPKTFRLTCGGPVLLETAISSFSRGELQISFAGDVLSIMAAFHTLQYGCFRSCRSSRPGSPTHFKAQNRAKSRPFS